MVYDAWMSLLAVLAYLLGTVGGLAWRAIEVFVGTYQSTTWKVRRAGAVADLNAAVLAVAVTLLLTSRAAFSEAQSSTSRNAWLSQLSEKPVMACNTFNREPFEGTLYHDLTFQCEAGAYFNTSSLDINAAPQENMQQVLQILGFLNDCDAFFMAFRVQRQGNRSQLKVHKGKDAIRAALSNVAKDLGDSSLKDSSYYLDEIWPLDLCATHPSEGFGAPTRPSSGIPGDCSDRSAGFPPNTKILRYLSISKNVGLFLNYDCRQDGVVGKCFSNHPGWQNLTLNKTGLMRGDVRAFCPLDGKLSMTWNNSEPYHCAEGFDISQSLDTQKAKVEGLRLVYKFPYFYPCLSYDELFGVYIAMVGVFTTVVLGTCVLLFTDVVCPMLKCGSDEWRASLPPLPWLHASTSEVSPRSPGGGIHTQLDAHSGAGADMQSFQALQDSYRYNLVDIVLRCMASVVLGTLLSVFCVWLPWRYLPQDTGSCAHLAPPALVFCSSK